MKKFTLFAFLLALACDTIEKKEITKQFRNVTEAALFTQAEDAEGQYLGTAISMDEFRVLVLTEKNKYVYYYWDGLLGSTEGSTDFESVFSQSYYESNDCSGIPYYFGLGGYTQSGAASVEFLSIFMEGGNEHIYAYYDLDNDGVRDVGPISNKSILVDSARNLSSPATCINYSPFTQVGALTIEQIRTIGITRDVAGIPEKVVGPIRIE